MLIDDKFVIEHPNMTLSELIAYRTEKINSFKKQEEERENNHKKWIIDNLCGKKVIYRMNGAFNLIAFEYDAIKDKITPTIYYEFYFVEPAFLDHKNSSRFRFDNLKKDEKACFNIKWIKSPYNDDPMAQSAYIMSDKDFEDTLAMFKSFEDGYNRLLGFENNKEIATKVF